MARFLFAVWPYPGHLHPNAAIAHALAERGHDVAFYTGGSAAPALQDRGFICFPFESVDERHVEHIVLALDAQSLQWWKARDTKRLLREWLLGTVEAQLRDLDAVLSRWPADVIVCDPAMWGPILVLHDHRKLPVAIMSYVAACMLPGPDGPILGLSLPRVRGRLAQVGHAALRRIAHVLSADVRAEANTIRSRYGLAPIATSVTAFSGSVPLYLVPSTAAYDRGRSDLPGSVKYVGPCEWDRAASDDEPSWLAEMPRHRPVVYVTEGTMHSKPPFLLRAALKGLASSNVQVVATTGKHRSPEALALGEVPPNARVAQWVPHSSLLPRTDVLITTGGTGTVMAALGAGVPMLIVPTAWDQPENAWRVAEAGAGIRLSARRCTPANIRATVDRLLNDPTYRENARRLGADLAGHGGAEQAARLLETLVSHAETRNILHRRPA
jgi:MGT family glycosyltransferase